MLQVKNRVEAPYEMVLGLMHTNNLYDSVNLGLRKLETFSSKLKQKQFKETNKFG